MKQSLRRNLTINMVSLLVGTVTLIGIFAFGRATVTIDDLSSRIVRQTAGQIDERLGALLDRAESQCQLLGGLAQPTAGVAGRVTATRFPELGSQMLEMMRVNPEFGSVTLTLAATGEHVQVAQKPNGSLVVQTSTLGSKANRVRTDLVPFGDELRQIFRDDAYRVDNRSANWYTQSVAQSHLVWSEAYMLKDAVGQALPGVTCSAPVFDRANDLVGVVTVDFTIGNLSTFVQTMSVGENGYAFLLEYSSGGPVKVIAHPESHRLLIPEGDRQRLAKPEELGDGAVLQIISRTSELQPGLRPGRVERIRLNVDGKRYFAGAARISDGSAQGTRPAWVVGIVVPDADFMSSVWQSGISLGVLGALAVATGVALCLFIAQRVSRPLRALADETTRIRNLDLAERPIEVTNIREIDELATGVESMKTGLRSLEILVPGDYARSLIRSGKEAKLGGERRTITTSFADIIGFTRLSELLEPEELVDILAEYLDVISEQVLDAGGTIDKFNGDDVMAFWGAPTANADHAADACRAAIRSQSALVELHRKLVPLGKPALMASFGIATGDVVVGNVGSRKRMNYTVIGDSVNLASRLQGLNKVYKTEALVSDRTAREASGLVVTRMVDWVNVAGRDESETIHQLVGLRGEVADDAETVARMHNEAMVAYAERRFGAAAKSFDDVLRIFPSDGLALRAVAMARRYATEPPGPDWDPAERVTQK